MAPPETRDSLSFFGKTFFTKKAAQYPFYETKLSYTISPHLIHILFVDHFILKNYTFDMEKERKNIYTQFALFQRKSLRKKPIFSKLFPQIVILNKK